MFFGFGFWFEADVFSGVLKKKRVVELDYHQSASQKSIFVQNIRISYIYVSRESKKAPSAHLHR